MKVLLDPQIYNNQVYGGISRYYTEIFSNLSKRSDVTVVLPLVASKNVYLQESVLLGKEQKKFTHLLRFLSVIGISIRKKVRKINTKKTIETITEKDFDLFVPTYYSPYFLDHIGHKPFVLTIYDMIHELFPEHFINDPYEVLKNKKILIEKATMIIAVSNNTKKDLLKIYPTIDESIIKVIYHGNSLQIKENIRIDLPENYILFVGSREHYKNFHFLVNSMISIFENDSTLKLVCAGGGDFDTDEIKFIDELKLTARVIHKSFKDAELGMFYKRAKCFVFPSSYEGFGIPVLEAMSNGCPIVLTNNSSFPEVAGDAGLFYKLNDGIDLKNKIELLLNDPELRKHYSEKGLVQSRKYSWKDAANQCYEVYLEAINRAKRK